MFYILKYYVNIMLHVILPGMGLWPNLAIAFIISLWVWSYLFLRSWVCARVGDKPNSRLSSRMLILHVCILINCLIWLSGYVSVQRHSASLLLATRFIIFPIYTRSYAKLRSLLPMMTIQHVYLIGCLIQCSFYFVLFTIWSTPPSFLFWPSF